MDKVIMLCYVKSTVTVPTSQYNKQVIWFYVVLIPHTVGGVQFRVNYCKYNKKHYVWDKRVFGTRSCVKMRLVGKSGYLVFGGVVI